MTVKEAIDKISPEARQAIIKGWEGNFRKCVNNEGIVTDDHTEEFNVFQDLCQLVTTPLTDFYRENGIPNVVTYKNGRPYPTSVGDAIIYMLDSEYFNQNELNKHL